MITITLVTNPLIPEKDAIRKTIYVEKDVASIFNELCKEAIPYEIACAMNGRMVPKEDWGSTMARQGSHIVFSPVPKGLMAIITIVIIAISFAIGMMVKINPPKVPGELPEPDPVQTLTGQKNQIKLRSPIEVPYGYNRLWPSYIAKPYNQYIDNNQWIYFLLCVGQGSYDIESVKIEDTLISSFQDVYYEVYGPGVAVTLFPDNVVTAVEVSNIELFAENEVSYPEGNSGFVGGFVVNPAYTRTTTIEVDISFTQGLYYSNDEGGLDTRTITVEFEYRAINDQGNPIGPWVLLVTDTKTMATTTPQRVTLSTSVASGRYEVRGRRTGTKDLSSRAGNTVVWEAVRAFLPSIRDYGDITKIAVKARASNNLNDNSNNRVNVYATRKLPVYNAETHVWSDPVATRSIVWAFCDVFRSKYGAAVSSTYLNLSDLAELDAIYTSQGYTFDWVFDQRTTIWDAARSIARAGRATPVIRGSSISMVRDEVKTIPVAVFSGMNTVKGSFRYELGIAGPDDHDGLEVEYIDQETGKPETILCTLPNEDGDNPDKMTLTGITNRTQAYQEGLYLRATQIYHRENVIFKTGAEGIIPVFGDLIAVVSDIPEWGDADVVKEIITDGDGTFVVLSKPYTFVEGSVNEIAFKNKDGSAAGPYEITETDDPAIVRTTIPIVESFDFTGYMEPPFYMIGTSNDFWKLCTVVGVSPSSDGEEVEIQSIVYAPEVFSFGSAPTPERKGSTTIVVPDLPQVTGFVAESDPSNSRILRLKWTPTLGAQSYVIQKSLDNSLWENVDRVTTTSYVLPVRYGYLYLRLAAVNIAQGPWALWEGQAGVSLANPGLISGLSLQETWEGLTLRIKWEAMLSASLYKVTVSNGSNTIDYRTTNTAVNEFEYTSAQMISDSGSAPVRTLRIGVVGVNGVGVESVSESVLTVSNSAPSVLLGLSVSRISDSPTEAVYQLSFTPTSATDFLYYRIWGSASTGFTPGPGNLQYQGTATTYDVTIPKTSGTHPDFFWRAAALDVWGETGINISAEQTITYVP